MDPKDIEKLFCYRPEPEAVKRRMFKEAAQLLDWGRDGEIHQPEITSWGGQLNKLYLYLTFDCPLRCPYCYAEGGTRKTAELDAENFLRITEEAVMAGYRSVVVVGGEPLYYREFDRYLIGLEKMDRRGTRFILRSSFGFPVEDDLMKRLAAVFDEIVVSIDGDEETHDAVRGAGTWKLVTNNTEKAVAFGANIGVNSVLSKEKAEGEPGDFLKAFCKNLGIQKLIMQSPLPIGRAANSSEKYYEWRSNRKQLFSIRPKFSCGIGHSLYIHPDGRVYPCYAWCEEEHLLGNLSKESLQEILKKGKWLAIINTGVDTNEKCRDCEVRYFCGGMCKIWASNHYDINSGVFDCSEHKKKILDYLKAYGILKEK